MSKVQRCLTVFLLCCSLSGGKELIDNLLPRPVTAFQNSTATNTKYEEINRAPPKPQVKLHAADVDRSIKFVSSIVDKMKRLETNLGWADVSVKPGTPLHGQLLNSHPENEAMQKGKHAIISSKATVQLMHKFCLGHKLSKSECAKYLSNIQLSDKISHDMCWKLKKSCSTREIFSKYRSADGSCNDAFERSRGQSLTPYKRLLFSDYADGIQQPRRSVVKRHDLPSAREISAKLVKHLEVPDTSRTMMVAQWAQFVAHDMSHTVSSNMLHFDKTIKCCSNSGRKLSPRHLHPLCDPIEISESDKFYSQHGLKCMSYVRSVPVVGSDCTLGPLEQLNQATHLLDASNIYGSDKKTANQLRLMERGLLKSSSNHGKDFLPILDNTKSSFGRFMSGDSRADSLPGLLAMHTVWLREHNNIAELLGAMNPSWNDETLYQEARRIVIAEIQHITYNEWLPTVLGQEYVNKMTYLVNKMTHLDSIEDSSISNSFATAAMRFDKSLLDNYLHLYSENRTLDSSIRMKDFFHKPQTFENLDAILRGLATQNSHKADLNFGSDITSQLYSNGKYGYDVVTLDIHRGRDHGLPSYTAFRSLCGLPEVKKFEDFLPDISRDIIAELSKVYKDPHDVDLLIGGLAETPLENSLLGPTFSCLVSDQFLRTRFGDRYFHDYQWQPKPFTAKQLSEIRHVTLARILCDNSDDMQTMQPNAFRPISESNPLVNCHSSEIPHLNLAYWMQT